MKLSKEVRIGILVTVSLLVFFAGFYFLKGANVFSGENEYHTFYDNVEGLQPSAPVQVKGMSVGRVSKIELNGNEKVKVTISVSKKVKLPQGTAARLAAADLLGTKVISLDLGSGAGVIEDDATLPASIEGGILDNLSVEISPLIKDLRHAVNTLDTILISVSGVLNEQTQAKLSSSIESLDITMKNFSELSTKINGESDQLASVIRNANSITSNLANNNQAITDIISNAKATTEQLSNAPIEQTFKDLQAASNQLQGVIQKMNSNQGTLGMLVNDKQLYENLTQSLKTLDLLIADVNAHPYRYINVTIFGRKNKDK